MFSKLHIFFTQEEIGKEFYSFQRKRTLVTFTKIFKKTEHIYVYIAHKVLNEKNYPFISTLYSMH